MSANQRDCVIVPFRLEAYLQRYKIDTKLCDPCDPESKPTINMDFHVFDQGESTKKVSLAGLHMMHIVASNELAACVKVSVRRIVRCRNCAAGCGTDEFYVDMGCLNTGHVFATGDYEIVIEPQLNMANIDPEEEIKLDLVFEPVIDEHIHAALFNKC